MANTATPVFYTFGARRAWVCDDSPLVSGSTLIELPGIQTVGLAPEMIAEPLTTNDLVQDIVSYQKMKNITLENAQFNFEAWSTITGWTAANAATGNTLEEGFANNLPRFSLVLEIYDFNGNEAIIYAPICKIMSLPEYSAEQEGFSTASLEIGNFLTAPKWYYQPDELTEAEIITLLTTP